MGGVCVRVTVNSLEGPGVAITVRLEVFWSQYGSGLKHLHEHHVTHHPKQTCIHSKTFSVRQEMHHRCKTHAFECVYTHHCVNC